MPAIRRPFGAQRIAQEVGRLPPCSSQLGGCRGCEGLRIRLVSRFLRLADLRAVAPLRPPGSVNALSILVVVRWWRAASVVMRRSRFWSRACICWFAASSCWVRARVWSASCCWAAAASRIGAVTSAMSGGGVSGGCGWRVVGGRMRVGGRLRASPGRVLAGGCLP